MSIFTGYSGQVWSALYAALAYYDTALTTAPTAGSTITLSEAMLASLLNGAAAINAADTAAAWNAEQNDLADVLTLPLTIDPTSLAFVTARLAAYEASFNALSPLVPQPPFAVASSIASGVPVIPDANLLGFYASYDYETPPAGLTSGNFNDNAALVATSFAALAQAVNVFQGVNSTSAYDTAAREAQITGIVANLMASLTSGPVASNIVTTNAWNQVVTLPATTILARQMSGAPFLLQAQQSAVIRYAILNIAQQIAQFLLILRQPQTAQISLTTLYNNETLMDVAARTLNNFERWTDIATINGLSPPYVGPVALPGIAAWGSQLILPTTGTQLSATGGTPSYEANFLGTDVYVGPINGVMPPWTGDYQTITGYNNLSWALGRRLQTTLSTLIYHNNYGSRIPPEVGQVQGSVTAGNIVAYGKSALLSDGRVQAVLSASASGYPQGIDFKATVQPGGFGSQETSVNEVISVLP